MKIQAPFGFVTGCHAGDKFMVQATLASMRHYCPTVPICLVVDGHFDVTALQKQYDLCILRITDLPSAAMRTLIGSNQRAKLAAIWEGPFNFFVWLDSDAIVWGDFTSHVNQELDFQIFWKEAQQLTKPAMQDGFRHYYFDPQLLKQIDPRFDWRGNNYFCSGVFGCRRQAITFKEWVTVEEWNKENHGLFSNFGEMGLLNYLVHAKSQRGEIKMDSADLQHVWAHHGKRELEEDCIGAGWRFPKNIKRPRVAHFCYRKPFLFDRQAYSRPFTIARLEHYRKNLGNLEAWVAVINEDRRVLSVKIKNRLARMQKRV